MTACRRKFFFFQIYCRHTRTLTRIHTIWIMLENPVAWLLNTWRNTWSCHRTHVIFTISLCSMWIYNDVCSARYLYSESRLWKQPAYEVPVFRLNSMCTPAGISSQETYVDVVVTVKNWNSFYFSTFLKMFPTILLMLRDVSIKSTLRAKPLNCSYCCWGCEATTLYLRKKCYVICAHHI